MSATIAPSITLSEPGDDQSGLCHHWHDGASLCGVPRPAPDSPGPHRGATVDGQCTGCGRPRCPDCHKRAD